MPELAQLHAIISGSSDAIVACDLDGIVTLWNRSAESILGYSADEMIGASASVLFPPSEQSRLEQVIEKLKRNELLPRIQAHRVRRDGSLVELEIAVSPVRDDDGMLVGVSMVGRDLSEVRRRERELHESEKMLRRCQAIAHIGSFSLGVDPSDEVFLTEEAVRIFGYDEQEKVTTAQFEARLHEEDRTQFWTCVNNAHKDRRLCDTEIRVARPDSAIRWVQIIAESVAGEDGKMVGLTGVVQDVTERRVADRLLRESERRFRTISQHSPDLVVAFSLKPERLFRFVSNRVTALTGYLPSDLYNEPGLIDSLLGASLDDLVVEAEEQGGSLTRNNVIITKKDGAKLWTDQRFILYRDESGEVSAFHNIVIDATERREAEKRLEYEAEHDPLTGLGNRTFLIEAIEQAIAEKRRRGTEFAVLFVDLDRFKLFNDTRGHLQGDLLLRAVAQRLQQSVGSNGVVGRVSGDEFVVVVTGLLGISDAIGVAERMTACFDEPFHLDHFETFLSASIGIALGESDDSPEGLLRNADLAMYQAKQSGRNRFDVYDEALRQNAEERIATESGIRRALQMGELFVEYQPIALLGEDRFVGAEALVRWRHPEQGVLGPGKFLQIAEDAGLIIPIGNFVIEEACRTLAAWQEADGSCDRWRMSVNISAAQLRAADFPDALEQAMSRSGVRPSQIELELTESVLMHADLSGKSLGRLQDLGVRLVIDDFGTGFSSLSYLKQFPVDGLKIDQSFVRSLDGDPFDATIVEAVLLIGDALGIEVTAEGVETSGQLARLRSVGCGGAQGFYFSPPLAPDRCLERLRAGPSSMTRVKKVSA